MATKQNAKRTKNPAAAGAREEAPFPFLDPDYPIKPWVNPMTRQRFQTVSIRYKNGWIATIAEAPEIQASAKTQAEAEQAVMKKFNRRANPQEMTEDEIDLLYLEKAKRGSLHDVKDVMREFGYGVDGKRFK